MLTPIEKVWIKSLFACTIPPPITLFSMVYYTQIAQVCKFIDQLSISSMLQMLGFTYKYDTKFKLHIFIHIICIMTKSLKFICW